MSHIINRSQPIYAFSKEHAPILNMKSGETVIIETYDCFENQITSNNSTYESLDWSKVNPATGPVYVEGAEVGDVLEVTIDDIKLEDQGVMAVSPGMGVLGEKITKFEAKLIPIENGKAIFNENIHIPLNPMIGVIGVAPQDEPISCGTPGSHGGNMDNKMITKGTTLYFPVFQQGALFALGDLHAAMGDGEVCVTGIEIAGQVTVTIKMIKGKSLSNPVLETEEFIGTIASAKTIDEAVKMSVEDMVELLQDQTSLPLSELTMLLSAVGQTQICQVVDPLMTTRFLVPKWVLEKSNVSLF
ncbi:MULTISPECIES: acetamidase/formamidase family protein [Bacillaceae]|uniref:acetamidase/formamidase family protein n=1 Tax=Bacillaceae TaxID=186817 RepID=UPI000BFE60CA|nr:MULTISPECIES: acetamidase/formamidase family protein [Bacillaceae]PGT85210.1 acetamidase [Bacillus sp. AFS040349]UGB31943.1 acetamidase/formamidase family protein [Metabacillus sp. B2-18]